MGNEQGTASFGEPPQGPKRRRHRRTLSTIYGADLSIVFSIFRKHKTTKGELLESGCKIFFDDVFGPISSKRGPEFAKRLLELRTFIQHAKSESASTIDRSVVTEGSLRAYLLKNDGEELSKFATSIKRRLAETGFQDCVDDIHKENDQSLANMKQQKKSNLKKKPIEENGFICCQCDLHFETWPQCLSHLRQLNHMNAQQKTKGLRRKCRKKYDTFAQEESGYRCINCAETFLCWKDCYDHQSATGHSGSVQKCHSFYEQWKNESAI